MFEQYKITYDNAALEPHIDVATMETHYGKHYAAYTKTFNEAAEKAGVTEKSVEEILKNLDKISDEGLRKMLRNHGGGYYNHNLYFMTLSPNGGDKSFDRASESFKAAVDAFGGLGAVKEKMSAAAAGQFGSGWAFLSATPDGKLIVSASPNQDNPFSEGTDNIPIVALDVWEHAYYLKYRNLRADYIKAFWEVIDWGEVGKLYDGR